MHQGGQQPGKDLSLFAKLKAKGEFFGQCAVFYWTPERRLLKEAPRSDVEVHASWREVPTSRSFEHAAV